MTSKRLAAMFRTAVRLLVLLGFAVLVNLALNLLLKKLADTPSDQARMMLNGVLVLALLLYVLTMAIPFVPSIEIGLSLLMMRGADIAPFVFLGTFSGLSLAFLAGRLLPYRYLNRVFSDIGLTSASRLLTRLDALPAEDRLTLLQERLPQWLGPKLVKYRYVLLAIVLNVPGNGLIGGGGGIGMITGLSGVFRTRFTLLTFALAVAPVPIAVYLFGYDPSGMWPS